MRPKPITAGSCLFSPPWSRYLKHNVSVLTRGVNGTDIIGPSKETNYSVR
jgi:hypothetical protein